MANLLHFERAGRTSCPGRSKDLRRRAPISAARRSALPVMTWTVRTPEERGQAAAGADQMVFEGFLP